MLNIDPEFKSIIPPLDPQEYLDLEQSILATGCRDSIVLWNDTIVDGHNRHEICCKHNISYNTISMDFSSRNAALIWIIDNQFARRNLPDFAKAELALKKKPLIAELAKENLKTSTGGLNPQPCQNSDKPAIDTKKEIAKSAGVSHDTVAKVETILKQATPALVDKARSGGISINAAEAISYMPAEQQQQVVLKTRDEIIKLANDFKKEKKQEKIDKRKAEIQQQRDAIEQGVIPVDGLFDVICIDPPWAYGREYDPDTSRVANPYPEMTQEELLKLNIPSSDNCVMFLWTTHAFTWDAYELLNEWGFTHKATLVWDKEKLGMGYWLRMQCEFCLVAIKGNPTWSNTTYRDIIREARREHSRKPEAFYELVNNVTVGRKLDYFSRNKRDGWEAYGNDTNRFQKESNQR